MKEQSKTRVPVSFGLDAADFERIKRLLEAMRKKLPALELRRADALRACLLTGLQAQEIEYGVESPAPKRPRRRKPTGK